MRFKQFLTEMEVTKRQGLVHFDQIKPKDFLLLARKILENNNKIEDVTTTLKVDGASIRFGKDFHGDFFFETGRSGIIQEPGSFSRFNREKGSAPELLQRAEHYDEMYNILESSNLWKDFPNGTKVVAEALYNPMAEVIEDKLKFVEIKYPKSKLGSVMTIVPLSITGDYDIKDLLRKSSDEIKIISPHLGTINLTIETDLEVVNEIDENILTSLKKNDKEKKEQYKQLLDGLKKSIAAEISTYPIKKDILGPEIEGIVVELHGQKYKITTPEFRATKAKKLNERLVAPLGRFSKREIPDYNIEYTSKKDIF